MDKPKLTKFEMFSESILHRYERYLPTAFDESLTLLEKMNKLIEMLNRLGLLTNDLVEEWQKVMEWVMNDGLSQGISDKLDQMVENGTLEELINDKILSQKADKTYVDAISERIDLIESRFIRFEDFGAVGNGIVDDTQAIQDAFYYASENGKKIVCPSGKNYKVSLQGTTRYDLGESHNSSDYAVLVPSNVNVDFNGSTVSNLDADYCSLFMNLGLLSKPAKLNENISFSNLKILGNIDVGYKTGKYNPGINFVGVDNVIFNNIYGHSIINSGLRVLKCNKLFINEATFKRMWGNGIYLGITKDSMDDTRVHNAIIDNIYIEETIEDPLNLSSNSVIATLVDSIIGKVHTYNCSWGFKLQNDSENVQIETVQTRGGDLSTLNSGLRLQGLSDSRPARNINVSNVISIDCEGSGLYIQFGDRININNYIGEGNGHGGYSDVWIHRRNISINNISLSNAHSSGISLRPGSSEITLGSVIASNVNGTVISDSSLNSVVSKVVISNTNPAFNTERAINTLTSSTNTIIDKLYNKTNKNITFGLISHRPKINELFYTTEQVLHDFEISLSNGATRTDIMNKDIVYMNNGTGSYQKTRVELIQISGRPLPITSQTYIDGGYRVNHDTAIGDEVFRVKIGQFSL